MYRVTKLNVAIAGGVAFVMATAWLAASAPVRAEESAATKYQQLCASCHGPTGASDGPVAAALNPKPANFTSADFHKARTDAQIKKAIKEGGAAVGKSPTMPAFASQITDAQADALVKHLRSLKKK